METAIKQSRDIVKIAVLGPESTGKSTLAEQLAAHFETVWVKEFAREYLEKRNGEYEEADLLAIAKGQIAAENEMVKSATDMLFCDTELITIKIWSEYKYSACDPWIAKQIQNRKYDLYLLCYPDIPWKSDPLRENPDDRVPLYKRYKNELIANNFSFIEIRGGKAMRLQTTIAAIKKIFDIYPSIRVSRRGL